MYGYSESSDHYSGKISSFYAISKFVYLKCLKMFMDCLRRWRKTLHYYFTPKICETTSVKNTLFIYSQEKLMNNVIIAISIIVVITSIKYLRLFVSMPIHYTLKRVWPKLINKYYPLVFIKKRKTQVVTIKSIS